MPTFYVTKYALTEGIVSAEFPEPQEGGNYVSGKLKADDFFETHYLLEKEAFRTPDAASADAERRRVAKIASLQKQIAKLEKLSFS